MATPTKHTLDLRDARAYVFRVLYKGKPRNIEGVEGMKGGEFVLPRNPVSVQYQAAPRTGLHASGTLEQIADHQGVEPPTITLGLDFGERGSYDTKSGKGMDGRQIQRALEDLIRGYLKATTNQGRKRQPMHVLEFHDIYRGESWVVTPQNVPYGMEDNSRPFAESSSLRLQALRRADDAIPPADPISAALRDKFHACPLNPGCKYGGPREKGCPYGGK